MIAMPLTLAACATGGRNRVAEGPRIDPQYVAMYSTPANEPFAIPPVDLRRVDPQWWRQEVAYTGGEKPGTIVVDTPAHHLYLVQAGGTAMRYGVGVGREEALQFKGNATIGRKAEWPTWTPTNNMIKRDPERYASYARGLPGGLENPLGARALYLYRGGNDTHFRLHGTTEPYSIGTNVSSGCIRLMNQDIVDLYGRVSTGAQVIVRS
jgi:lipoprotein-anchoring transpeptidase ErfK/SrfK